MTTTDDTTTATPRVLDAEAAEARAKLISEREAAAIEAGTAPEGYELAWAYPAGYSRWSKIDKNADGPAWLTRCDVHGKTKPADGAKAARSQGAKRPEWCSGCKADAKTAATAKAKADKAKADKAAAKATADAAAAAAAKSSTSESTTSTAGTGRVSSAERKAAQLAADKIKSDAAATADSDAK